VFLACDFHQLCLPYMHKFSADIIDVYLIDLLVLLMQ